MLLPTRKARLLALAALTGAALSTAALAAPGAEPRCFAGESRFDVVGTRHADVIVGTRGPDRVHAGHGDDVLVGLDGDDLLCGGAGGDRIVGGDGADRLDGADDALRLAAEAGRRTADRATPERRPGQRQHGRAGWRRRDPRR